MKMPTHGLVGYALARLLGWEGSRRRLAVAGALAPDSPVAIAGAVAAATTVFENGSFEFAVFKAQMDQLYFFSSFLGPSHSLLHAPLSLALLAALAMLLLDAERRSPVLAFLAGAASHSAVDIFTHVNDGPLLFWPLDWETRLTGPLSHWDANHGGLLITSAECCVWACMLIAVSRKPLHGLPFGWFSAREHRRPRLAGALLLRR